MVEIFLFKSGFFIQVDTFFSSWGFQLKSSSFVFKSRCFNSSRDPFYLSRNVLLQVAIFFVQVEMFQFKSKSFLFKLRCFNSSRDFFMSRFSFSSREFFFMSRFLFQVEIFISFRQFFHIDIFLLKRRIFFFISGRDFCYLGGLSRGHFWIQGEMLPRSTCWHLLAMIK